MGKKHGDGSLASKKEAKEPSPRFVGEVAVMIS
jgi:hypothetical protein